MRSYLVLPAVALGVALCAACATLNGEQAPPDYAADANTNLQRGNAAFDAKNFEEAQRYYEYVRTRYPFLDAAKEAELRIADSYFEREQFIEARDAYDNFVKLHPTYPRADYAAFRSALTHYKDIPSDFFLLPPPEEKDQVEVRAAVSAMNDFVRQYPKSKFVPEAQQVIAEARKRLAKHELYVADFYARREKWRAVVNRLQTVVKDYPGLGFDEQALFGLYDAYNRLKEPDHARQALEQLIQRLPGTAAAEKAKALLGRS
ncbi:MAG: outer membrane protein assembly factor BamD [Myxococcaceae bacterium]|nr:outer membrane protein assembly factor BamD [Myxococcaceae bacterium]